MSKVLPAVELGFNAEVRAALAEFNAAKELEKEAKERKAQAADILRNALGSARAGTIGGVVAFKLQDSSNRSVNYKVLETKYPDAYNEVVSVSEYDFVKSLKI